MPDDLDKVNLPPPEAATDPLAEALARLEPSAARLDRDRLMFEAGAASRRNTIRLWQAAAGFLAAVGFAAGMTTHRSSIATADRELPPLKAAPTDEKPIGAPGR